VALLPENFGFMGRSEADKLRVAERDGSGPMQDFLAEAAARHRIWLVGGTLPMRVPDAPARTTNTCLVYDAAGRRVARYDKIHLFDVDLPGRAESYRESACVERGRAAVAVDTPVGRVGLSVCYDVRFPELYRALVGQGAQILVVPAAFTVPTGQAHWEVLLRARAIENMAYVVAAAQSGRHANGRETYGDSLIADYWGRVLDRLAQGPGLVVADIDLAAQAAARESFPVLANRVFGA
jgi:deaminated glutathione amidase